MGNILRRMKPYNDLGVAFGVGFEEGEGVGLGN